MSHASQVFEWLGVERSFGVQSLSRLAPKLGSDPATAQKVQIFSQACSQAGANSTPTPLAARPHKHVLFLFSLCFSLIYPCLPVLSPVPFMGWWLCVVCVCGDGDVVLGGVVVAWCGGCPLCACVLLVR